MPELPEVQTYVQELKPNLLDRTIIAAQVQWPRIIAMPSAENFAQKIIGQRFTHFERRGKYMLLGLASGDTLIVHLRMTGKVRVYEADVEPDKHTHTILALDDGRRLHYHDTRKFGRLWLVDDPQTVLYKLGPEPLGADFTPEVLAQALAKRRGAIKSLLLDQAIVAGLGNIYVDEVLFASYVHPLCPGNSLTPEEIQVIHGEIQRILGQAIERGGSSLGGSSLQNYLRPGGEQGGYQDAHQVFRRTGQPCPRCGQAIQRIVVTQRSTHFCPQCQPLKGKR